MATSATADVTGIFLKRPPILKISCSWWQAWIIDPATRNNVALKNAWVVRWNIAKSYPRPMPVPIKPRWARVE